MRKIKRKKKRRYKESEVNRCCWCDVQIPSDVSVVALDAKLKGIFREKLIKDDGYLMPLTLKSLGKTVLAAIAAKGSEAHLAGSDVLFLCCGKECGVQIKRAVDNELEMFSHASFG